MQLSEQTSTTSETIKSDAINWSRAFNTSILSTALDSLPNSAHLDGGIETILSTPEYAAILLAAQSLAANLQISPEAATERLIQTFRNIDSCWEKILIKKGAQSLLGL